MPLSSQTSISSSPFGALTSLPSIVSLTVSICLPSLVRSHRPDLHQIVLDPALEIGAEFVYRRLHGHRRRVAEGAEALAQDLVGQVVEQFDIARPALIPRHA